jgi:aryl-alcohol dehydrogenase-like predicted oxidoreductase
MSLSPVSRIQFTSDMHICRVINGMWQVSGAHGPVDAQAAIKNMLEYHQDGFTTWDLADHYGPAEDFVGEFRRQLVKVHGRQALESSQAFTKWVPNPQKMTRRIVQEAIERSLRRMDVERLDLLQFHWWDYTNPNYLDALTYLNDLCAQGKIRHLALTNFDAAHLKTILDNGIRIVSNQVQFSLIDRRPEVSMTQLCQEKGVWLLPYGTVCGGLLSEKYLGKAEPPQWELNTASLRKYKQMIDAWGGWFLFQELLKTLQGIADKHQVTIPIIAMRYVLESPVVAGVIIGARLGVADHRQANSQVFDFMLDEQDRSQIQSVLERSHDLYRLIGDCGDEYRG